MEWAEGHPCRLSQPPSLTAPGRFCFTDWNHYALVLYSVTSLKLRSSLSVIRNYTCPLILANWWEGLSEDIIRGGGREHPLSPPRRRLVCRHRPKTAALAGAWHEMTTDSWCAQQLLAEGRWLLQELHCRWARDRPLGPPEMSAGILQGVEALSEQVRARISCISIAPRTAVLPIPMGAIRTRVSPSTMDQEVISSHSFQIFPGAPQKQSTARSLAALTLPGF